MMKIPSHKGFSILHILPVIAIVAAIAFIGVKVLDRSHAAIGSGWSCSSTFWRSGTTLYFRTTHYYKGGGWGGHQIGLAGRGLWGSNQWMADYGVPSLASGKSYTRSGSLGNYWGGNWIWAFSGQVINGAYQQCPGRRWVWFP